MKYISLYKYAYSPAALLLLALGYLTLLLVLGTSSPFLVVRGVSMVPTYHNGDMLLNRRVQPTSIRVGDVIVFDVPEESRAKLKLAPIVAHRVIGIEGAGGQLVFVTKGDNTEVDPFKVPAHLVRGLVITDLGPLGHPILFLSQKKVWLYVGLPLLVFSVVVGASLALSPRQKSASPETKTGEGTSARASAPTGPLPEVPTPTPPPPLPPVERQPPLPQAPTYPRTHKAMVRNLQEATRELQQILSARSRTPETLVQAVRKQDRVLLQLKAYVSDPREFQQSNELEEAIDGYNRALVELQGLTRDGSDGPEEAQSVRSAAPTKRRG